MHLPRVGVVPAHRDASERDAMSFHQKIEDLVRREEMRLWREHTQRNEERKRSRSQSMRHQPHIVRVLAALVVAGRFLRELTETPKRWR